MLTDAEKAEARRFMGYNSLGAKADADKRWRFYQAAGLVEYRLNNLSSSECDVARRYIASLTTLEAPATEGLDAAQSAQLLRDWRLRFTAFLGVPPGPELRTVDVERAR